VIKLYRNREDTFADKIAEQLENLAVAYKIYITDHCNPDEEKLPYLKEGNKTVSKNKEIEKFLYDLSLDLKDQRSVTGDSCYIDPETGEIC